jgi:hypothetical protein
MIIIPSNASCPVNISNTTTVIGNNGNSTYIQNDGYIPIEIWVVLVVSGLTFLVLSLLIPQRSVILAVTATFLLGAAAAASLLLVITGEMLSISPVVNETIVNGTQNTTILEILIPVKHYVGSVWLAILVLGITLVAALQVFFGYGEMMIKDGEEADEIIDRGRMDTVNIPDMRNIANQKYGSKNNKFK